jgi:hypothetical protein
VLDFAVNDRREAVLRVADDVLPDVQDGAAGGIDQRAALVHEPGHVADRDTERGQNDHVVAPQRVGALARVREEPDAGRAKPVVDVGIVDDFAGQKDVLPREAAPRLIRIVDGTVHAVAEAELAGEVDREPAGLEPVVVGPELVDDRAVVRGSQFGGHRLLHVEALAEDQRLG